MSLIVCKMVRAVNTPLKEIFYDVKNPAVFGTAKKLKQKLGFRERKRITTKKIKEWLQHQDVVTLHKPQKQKFNRNHYTIFNKDDLWEFDLCDMQTLAKHNDGYKYIMSVIDVFSKYGWMVPLKNKTAKQVTTALRNIITKSGRKPRNIQSDKGTEFKNATLSSFLKSQGIKQHFPMLQSLQKAAIVERFNRTMKEKMFKYFTYKGNDYRTYIDVLQDLVDSYNNTKHSTIKMAPTDVTEKNIAKVYANIKNSHNKQKIGLPKLEIDDFVRIIRKKKTLEHAYTEKWTREIFRVKQVIEKKPQPLYKVKDLKNVMLRGKFYENQLQKVLVAPTKVLKIIKTRGLGKNLQYFVETVGKETLWISQKEYNLRKI